jgi:NAD(P)H-dependent FMN reductase
MNKSPKLLFIDASPSENARSRQGLRAAMHTAEAMGALCTVLPASEWPVVESAEANDAVELAALAAAEADAWVVCGPVYDWAPAPQVMNALIHLLDSDGPRHRPMLFIAGAGSARSTLAYTTAVQMVLSEAGATVVGAPIVVAGDDVDKHTGALQPAVAARIAKQVEALVHFASAWRGVIQ